MGLTSYILWNDYQNLPSFDSINRISLLGVLTFYLIYLVIVSYRTLLILNELNNKDLKYTDWFKLNIKGRFINKLVPQGGNIYKGVILKKSLDLSYNKYIAYLGIFSWIDIMLNLLVCLILLILLDSDLALMGYKLKSIVFYLLLLIILVPFIFKQLVKNFKPNKIFDKLKIIAKENVIDIFKNLTLSNLTKVIFAGILSIFVQVGIYYYTFDFLNLYPDIDKILLYVSFIRISSIIQITPGNIGFQELLLGTLTELTGGTILVGVTVSLIIRLLTNITLGILSVIFNIKSMQINSKI